MVFALFYARFFRQTSLDYDTSCRYALHIFAHVNILVRKISVVHFVILFPDLVEMSIEVRAKLVLLFA